MGLPLIEQIGPSRFAMGYAIGLVGSGLWLTGAWVLNRRSLREAFVPPRQTRRQEAQGLSEDEDAGQEEEAAAPSEPTSTAATLTINGATPGMLGRYKVLKELGRGAMGLVYLGKDPTIQRFVAIKTMRLDQLDHDDKLQEVKARFFREAESTGRLSHPNIVTIYDAGEEDDLGYIAMELIEGTPLKQWARKPNLMPVNEVLLTVATVADALDYAHQQGVVHRDIKPANIMLTKDRVVKVMDFGIAKMASSSKTQTNIVLGTPTYMSPEQIAGQESGRSVGHLFTRRRAVRTPHRTAAVYRRQLVGRAVQHRPSSASRHSDLEGGPSPNGAGDRGSRVTERVASPLSARRRIRGRAPCLSAESRGMREMSSGLRTIT